MPVIHHQALSADVYELLVEWLLSPACSPGAPLNIDRLAEEWGVSQTPVREALARAATAGVVIREQHKGYRAADILPVEMYQALLDARALVEPYCAGRAAEVITDSELARLVKFQDTMESVPLGPTVAEYRQYLRSDIGLHRGIMEVAGNPFLVRAFDNWGIHYFRFQRFRGGAVHDAADSHVEHRAILAAIASHDPDAARDAMARHIAGVRSRM